MPLMSYIGGGPEGIAGGGGMPIGGGIIVVGGGGGVGASIGPEPWRESENRSARRVNPLALLTPAT
jgi:hypothetical protein